MDEPVLDWEQVDGLELGSAGRLTDLEFRDPSFEDFSVVDENSTDNGVGSLHSQSQSSGGYSCERELDRSLASDFWQTFTTVLGDWILGKDFE